MQDIEINKKVNQGLHRKPPKSWDGYYQHLVPFKSPGWKEYLWLENSVKQAFSQMGVYESRTVE